MMKHRIIYLIIITFTLGCYGSLSANAKILKRENPGINEVDFLKEPVKTMIRIYRNYHNWELDKGIRASSDLMQKLNEIYKEDPESKLIDPRLKLNKVFQVKSALHTLSGMLYFRQFLRKNGEIGDNPENLNSLLLESVRQFKSAIKTDPSNPSAYFHYVPVLKSLSGKENLMLAERAYYTTAKLSYETDDIKSVRRAYESLKEFNPFSEYLKKIEALGEKSEKEPSNKKK